MMSKITTLRLNLAAPVAAQRPAVAKKPAEQTTEPLEFFAPSLAAPEKPRSLEPGAQVEVPIAPQAPAPVDRQAVLAGLPLTSPMRALSDDEKSEIPDITFRLMGNYQQHRAEYAALPMKKGETVIVVPAYNEEKVIASTLESLRQNGGGRDVVISLNNTTDNTVPEIEKWAAQHSDVDLVPIEENSGYAGSKQPGRQRFFLLQSPEPGKVGAMLRPLEFLKNQGGIPENVFSMDADTQLGVGHLDQLEATAKARGLYAVCGKANFQAPPGESLSTMNEVLNRVHGEEGFESIIGNFVLYKSPDFFAGYKAIKETVPGIKTEDGLFGYMAASSGRPVGVDKSVVVKTLGFPPGDKADSQRRRWIQGGAQMERLFGPLNEKIGLGGMDNPFKIVSAQVKTLYRDNPVVLATWKTLGLSLQLGEGWKTAVEWVRGQDAPLEESYHWKPQR